MMSPISGTATPAERDLGLADTRSKIAADGGALHRNDGTAPLLAINGDGCHYEDEPPRVLVTMSSAPAA